MTTKSWTITATTTQAVTVRVGDLATTVSWPDLVVAANQSDPEVAHAYRAMLVGHQVATREQRRLAVALYHGLVDAVGRVAA